MPDDGMHARTSEDCLYLNVWVAGGLDLSRRRAVIFYMHGGAFLYGSGAMYPSYQLGHIGDVIVVTINYRLSSLGFLSTGDASAPGNYALWDGLQALTWVKNNIAAFGGDPEKITIAGQSAGASAVVHTMLSPHTRPLFVRAVAFSGAASARFGITDRHRQMADLLAIHFDCPTDDKELMLACLREERAEDIILWSVVIPTEIGYLPGWLPVIDGDFIPKPPRDAFRDGMADNKDLLIGALHHDGAPWVLQNSRGINGSSTGVAETPEKLDAFFRQFLRSFTDADVDEELDAVYAKYPDLTDGDAQVRVRTAVRAVTDWQFGTAVHAEAVLHSEGGPGGTFLYDLQYSPSFLLYPPWVNGTHGHADLYGLFGEAYQEYYRKTVFQKEFSTDDKQMRDTLIRYISNFAKYGNPNEGTSPQVNWPQYGTSSGRQFVRLSPYMTSGSIQSVTREMLDAYQFWDNMDAQVNSTSRSFAFPKQRSLSTVLANFDKRASLVIADYEATKHVWKQRITQSYTQLQQRNKFLKEVMKDL